jgi:hypothetical protein
MRRVRALLSWMYRTFRVSLAWVCWRFDMQDLLFACGTACLWWGCSEIYPPSARIVCGSLLIAVSLYSITRKVNP